jgi:hypothetical protein
MPSLLNENCVQLALEQESCLPHRKRALRQNGAYRMPPRRSPFPFLWNFLVDNLLRTVFLFPVLFAAYDDDTNVATSHKDPAIATQNLQLACNVVETWLNSRKLLLNAIKTVFVLFTRKLSPLTHLFLIINGIKIIPSLEVSFLGFLLETPN